MSSDRFDLASVVEASEMLNASLDLDFVLNNLLLVAMSRLLVGRGVVLLAEHERAGNPSGFWVAAAKGPVGLSLGASLHVAPPDGITEGEAVPAALRERGVALLLPVRHGDHTIGLVGLGRKATGAALEPGEVAFARSLVGVTAAAVHNARVAGQLQRVNLDLAARVHELDTLFELSRAFAAALDRDEALKLLGFTLMGQFLAERHAVLLRPSDGAPFETAAARGVHLDAEALAALASVEAPLRVGGGGDPVEAALRARRVAVALPLRLEDRVGGLLLVGPRATGRPFTDADLALLTALGTLALTAVERAALVVSRIEKERLEEEMRLARSIQERLLPRGLPAVEGFDLAAVALASRHVAGDYFDLLPLPPTGGGADGRLLLAVADVSGKGAPAALLMANLQALLRLLAHSFDGAADLAAATARVNRVVCENTEPTAFITFFWGLLDTATGRLRYVNAGHNPPRLVRADGAVESLGAGGLILGVLPEVRYEEGEATLAPGDTLALYTDGVTEALDPASEEYGEGRLDAVLVRHRTLSAPALLGAIRDDVTAFADGRPFADDLTLLILKRTT